MVDGEEEHRNAIEADEEGREETGTDTRGIIRRPPHPPPVVCQAVPREGRGGWKRSD